MSDPVTVCCEGPRGVEGRGNTDTGARRETARAVPGLSPAQHCRSCRWNGGDTRCDVREAPSPERYRYDLDCPLWDPVDEPRPSACEHAWRRRYVAEPVPVEARHGESNWKTLSEHLSRRMREIGMPEADYGRGKKGYSDDGR